MPLLAQRSIECDSAEFDALAQAILDEGLTLRFRAKGMSMHPFVRNGDILHVRAVAPDRVHIGELVLFRIAGSRVAVHRVLRKTRSAGKPAFVIKGDRVEQPDGVVPAENILGQVIARERNGVKIDLTTPARRLVKAGIAWLSPAWPVVMPIAGWLRSIVIGRNRINV
ncbi:MAG: signal peptidase I [Anaerolineae bacterium]|nr:signal peptidase I [Anaerolineae bacterium]